MDGRDVPQFEAEVHLHRNIPGKTELTGETFPLETPQGITVLKDGPRIPLLGLRAIVANKLKLIVDGERQSVTLKKGWF